MYNDIDIYEKIKLEASKKNLRETTVVSYCHSVKHFLNWVDKPVSELSFDDAEAFFTYKRLSGIASQTYNHYHSGVRFLYRRVLKEDWVSDDLPRMKVDRSLPNVLSKQDVMSIIDNTLNLKYKALFAIMYSGGLRVSEAAHLHYDDISRTNHTIYVRKAKNRMERYTILADHTLEILTEYWYQCGRPKGILFPSRDTGSYLTSGSINRHLKKCLERANLSHSISTHAFRHSFATHLFESGCDLHYIQALLGHRSSISTEVYIHVSNKTLLGVKSPFDEMGGDR